MKQTEDKKQSYLDSANLTINSLLDKIRNVYMENYGDDDIDRIRTVLHDLLDLFSGKMKGYLKCDTGYHDIKHTLQIIPPFVGIIDGWNKSGKTLKISKEFFDRGIIAVLLHDTGYIKSEKDVKGTGAKYTFIHTQRSADFASYYLSERGFKKDTVKSIRNIIMYTGVRIDYEKLSFDSEEEQIVGCALGTADLLGQMSSDDYPEKLLMLYREFEEAYQFEGTDQLRKDGVMIFKSAEDLIKHTPGFYENVVKERFKKMGSLHTYLTYHFDDKRNYFIEAIEKNIEKIKKRSASR